MNILEFFRRKFFEFIRWLYGWRNHERHYFVAHEVVFQITHPADSTAADILKAIQLFLKPDVNWKTGLRPPRSTSAVLTFQAQNDQEPTFSLVPIRLAWHWIIDVSPDDVISVLAGAYEDLQNGPLVMNADISLESISPNWFTKNLHHGGATGGPGSWPLEAGAPQQGARMVSEHIFQLGGPKVSLDAKKPWTTANKVNVAILDTGRPNHLVQAARAFMSPPAIPSQGASLIQYLFDAGLNVNPYSNPANPSELTDLIIYTPPPNHYEMPDHGTFSAGIIHTISPSAEIHLYEVLNAFGLGTLTSIAQGLINVIANHHNGGNVPLIINCSFMLDLITKKGVPSIDEKLNLDDSKISGLITQSVRGVIEWATGLKNVVIVAAAGNEAGSGRPDASYPAAFKKVVGVGALPKHFPTSTSGFLPTSYSNLSFAPGEGESGIDGFMTFGGELDNPQPSTNETPISANGVLGVYVGKVLHSPPANTSMNPANLKPSRTGWAHWAGTSFATPIITGLLAAKPTELVNTTPLPPPHRTSRQENVIVARQL